jgi:hypothetical protein
MKREPKNSRTLRRAAALIGAGIILGSLILSVPGVAQQAAKKGVEAKDAAKDGPLFSGFRQQVKDYVKLRGQLAGRLPKLSPESKPAEIDAHQVALTELLRTQRAGAKPGDIFTPAVSRHIRKTIREVFRGERLKELRQNVMTADTKGVPLAVNQPYPETKELLEMPPTLLLKLPELPKELQYRFVGRNLLLVDRGTRLILDYLPDALP